MVQCLVARSGVAASSVNVAISPWFLTDASSSRPWGTEPLQSNRWRAARYNLQPPNDSAAARASAIIKSTVQYPYHGSELTIPYTPTIRPPRLGRRKVRNSMMPPSTSGEPGRLCAGDSLPPPRPNSPPRRLDLLLLSGDRPRSSRVQRKTPDV